MSTFTGAFMQISAHTVAPISGREKEIPQSMQRLAAAANELDQIVSTLADRLSPVLSPALPNGIGHTEGDTPALRAPLSEHVETIADQYFAASDQLRSLLNRLEI